ncbi:MAG: hypothetical protein JXQ65_08210 [Candidatus Marinimicrobia bacterium]|nr:hypothetical protein [Candidatus Neomarinimicrobiota bacterium]
MAKKMIKGECRLCLKETLLCESHIYPKYFIKQTRDKIIDNKFQYGSNIKVKVPPQDGPKSHLLCKKCEHIIKIYEDYYKDFFIDKRNITLTKLKSGSIQIRGYNYKKLRLFLLSLLWRLSISPINDWQIKLNKQDQTILRNHILNGVPGSFDFFPFYTFLIHIDGINESSFFMNPFESDSPIKNCVFLYIFGVLYIFSKTSVNDKFTKYNMLTPEKWLCNIKNINDVPILMEKIKSINF